MPGGERGAGDVDLAAVDRPERLVEAEPLRAEGGILPGPERHQHLRGECLVDLVEVEVLEGEAVARQEARDGVERRGEEALVAGDEVHGSRLRVDEVRQRRQRALRGPILGGEQDHGGAVRQRR